ncbi:MAG: acyl carrier protein [Clostridia bacterium]|nr:acyl carrier protein [Clostridia bacterium]MBR5459370.1 acyl carrier protein [Clostridia bacterium]
MVNEIIEALSEQLKVAPEEMNENTSVIDDLGADSLDLVELLMTLEDRYGVIVPDDEAVNLKTIKDIAEYIEANKN